MVRVLDFLASSFEHDHESSVPKENGHVPDLPPVQEYYPVNNFGFV
jgi:hypothetical protein